jgi:thiamine-phosphate pyrophosphorylase
MDHASRMERFDASDLYVVITEAFCAGRSSLDVLDAVLAAGVTLVQFREKDWPHDKLYEIGMEFRRRTRDSGALLMVNDRLDIALAIEADGVHLGQSDLPVYIANRAAPDLIMGVSCHDGEEALDAQDSGASYVNIGPIFPTETKVLTMDALGPEAINDIAPDLDVPFTCMGGIKPHNIDQILSRGAAHPAVVTAVTAQPDVTKAASELREKIQSARKQATL